MTGKPELVTKSVEGTFYRFHKARFFSNQTRFFHRNFIATRGKWEKQERFAAAHSHCGFFFAKSKEIAVAEAAFYAGENDWRTVTRESVESILKMLGEVSEEHLFLEVEFSINNLVDFTEWKSIDQLMRHGTLQWKGKTHEFEIEYLAALVAEAPGGDELTSILGMDAMKLGYDGVVFPSVRALMFEGPAPVPGGIRQSLHDIKNMSAAANIMDLEWQGAEQLKQEWNIVVFSDTELTRSITTVSWTDSAGNSGTLENPLFQASADEIELERLRDRAHQGLDPPAAAKAGLLTAVERQSEFYCNMAFIRTPRQ
jgi:hypothetical protein